MSCVSVLPGEGGSRLQRNVGLVWISGMQRTGASSPERLSGTFGCIGQYVLPIISDQ